MKVLFVNHTAHRSGAGISLGTLVKALPPDVETFFVVPKRCAIMDVLGAEEERTFRERFVAQFMTTLYAPPFPPHLKAWHYFKGLWTFPRLARVVRRFRPDILHVNETVLLAHVFAGRRLGLPVVLHARTALAADRPVENFLLRRIGGMAGVRIVCIDGEVLASLPPVCRRIAEVVYNPVDLGPPPGLDEVAAKRAKWGAGPGDFVVGQAASLHAPKGIWLVLDLAEALCPKHERLRFVLVGDDSPSAGEGPKLREEIRRRGLEGRVVLGGLETGLAGVYAAFDAALCLFGGGLGGVGRAAYEAALSRRPLIATLPDPSQSETLKNGESALLFRQEDRAGIAGAIEWLLANPAAASKLAATAHQTIAPRHDPKHIAAKVMKIYSALLQTEAPTR